MKSKTSFTRKESRPSAFRWRRAVWIAFALLLAPAVMRGQVTALWTNTHFGPGNAFGAPLAPLGGGRIAVGVPKQDYRDFFGTDIPDAGWVSIYDQLGLSRGELGYISFAPTVAPGELGAAIAALPDGRLLATAAKVGVVYLVDKTNGPTGLLPVLGTWNNPAGSDTTFGRAVTALPGNRFAASSLVTNLSLLDRGKVFIFDASAVSPPLTVISNTAQTFDGFGKALALLGTDLLIGDTGNRFGSTPTARVLIYNVSGTLLRTIPDPSARILENFGTVIVPVDEHRFLVGAPGADVSYFSGGQQLTNTTAGKVYLFDDGGTLLRTFVAPDPGRSSGFGAAISLLGPDRVLIGAPQDRVGGITGAGAVYLFGLDGIHRETIDNPTPAAGDSFGAGLAAFDDRRFAAGAPGDDAGVTDGGILYGFDVPPATLELGAEIPRPDGLDISGTFPTQGPTVTPAGAAFWHQQSQKLFVVKPGEILVTWPLLNNQFRNFQATAGFPTNLARFQIHVGGPTPVDLSNGGVFSHAVLHASSTDADANGVSQSRRFSATTPGNSLLMLSSGDPTTNPIRFQLVRTIVFNDPAFLHDNAPAIVGQPIVDPAGYHDPVCGGPQVVVPGGVYAPAPVYDITTRTGPIIPVNRDNPATELDDLVVGFFQRGTKLFDPVTGGNVANNICWPYKPVRFNPQWPASAPHLIIASQQGTGPLDAAQFVGWELYVQNDPAQAGFNPNDEHALRRPMGTADGLFALRDDLGTAATSEPYVLIRFRDPSAGNQFRMKVWKVVAEEAPHFFRYAARAGLLIALPKPLDTLALAPETAGVSGPFFRDRKLFFWAKAAGNDGGTADIVMRYFYPVQLGFFFPGANPPALGENVPLLDLRAGTPGTPVDIHYDTTWPAEVPELRVGETLVKPKNGLPQIDGQSSVQILYQQAEALTQVTSVQLIDPTQIRSVPLALLPPDVTTRTRAGNLYFPALPPHLEGRVSYDPIARRLRLAGEFIEPPAGESYLLLNVLTPRDRTALASLTTDAVWQAAVAALATQAASVVGVPANSTGFDSLALSAGDARGLGYVTLAFGNSTTLSAPAEPISLSILKVTCPLYRGEIKVIESPNPLAETLTLRHSGDFAGRPDDFQFEWRTLPPEDGLPSPLPPEEWVPFQPSPATGLGALDITLSGPGLFTLSDNFFVVRYRRVSGLRPCGSGFSEWSAPMLAEGWIKRVLAGIGPFEQRIQDYQDTQVNTIVSMISQAGARAVGDVALNLDAVNQAGLIEIYETVLRRGMALSIDGVPAVDYAPANDALLLAAGRLADLYMLLGNEAYADAADPTIAFGTDDGVFGSQATSLHCFMNQTATLLEEELGLLRGRDNSKLPSVQTHPIYNRFIWNFTRAITGGEVAYALNYNIRDVDGDVTGVINEADAKRLYPQGHGDAWGHYLAAIKNYYRLLRNPNFTWVPRIEAVLVGGVPVSVDFLDERKFAAAAAARARTGAEIVNLTFRDNYVENPAKPWQTQPDPNANRAWGLGEWSSRAGQGALFDWVVANALLPDVDTNPAHTGIQKIERANIRELTEIAQQYGQIQDQVDQADSGRNPLGLANNVVPFDIDPSGIAAGKTHFDQINERANEALKNAVAVFDHANDSTQQLRRQADAAAAFQEKVVNQEADFNNRLIEIFGTPYADDIGPIGTYPSGYTGPDIYHYEYVENPEIRVGATGAQPTLQFQLAELDVQNNGSLTKSFRPVTFHFSPNGFGLEKPASFRGERSAEGELQMSRSALLEALRRLERGVKEYENLIDRIEDSARSLEAEFRLNATQIDLRNAQNESVKSANDAINTSRKTAFAIRTIAESLKVVGEGIATAHPRAFGLATDPLAPAVALQQTMARLMFLGTIKYADNIDLENLEKQEEKNETAALTDLKLFTAQVGFNQQERLRQLEQLVRGEPTSRLELAALEQNLNQVSGRYQAALARGFRMLEERTRFRQQTAAQIQTFRFKDMAFRVFRSDALEKYRAQFDLAARYAYLATKAYDYETCLAPGDQRGPGSAFLTSIIRSRSLGRFSNGTPLPGSGTGDPGLTDPLARMSVNWNLVLKGQLGFNNPQTETGRFSLRSELFRILLGSAGNLRWRETLSGLVVPNLLDLPEFRRHCIPFSPTEPVEPAIVIPFATTINFGMNFFGWPAGGGDNDYDSTKFATKIRSVGVWFANYNNLGGGMINTPRVYLVPVGLDVMRAPSQGEPYVREWRILDQALPVPFPLNPLSLNDPSYIPINDSLSEDFSAIRRFGRFRAFHDSGSFKVEETISDSRLIGRSVWNTRWLLIIPAGTLHTDRNEGIQRFINGALRTDGTRDGNGVADIRVFFQTYAYSGN